MKNKYLQQNDIVFLNNYLTRIVDIYYYGHTTLVP